MSPNTPGRVLETRRRDGLKWRRYRHEAGHTFATLEIPEPVLLGLVSMARVQQRLAAWHRGQERAAVRALGLELLARGWKPEAVANQLHVTARTAQKWRANALREPVRAADRQQRKG